MSLFHLNRLNYAINFNEILKYENDFFGDLDSVTHLCILYRNFNKFYAISKTNESSCLTIFGFFKFGMD